jgi:hypothetical protein
LEIGLKTINWNDLKNEKIECLLFGLTERSRRREKRSEGEDEGENIVSIGKDGWAIGWSLGEGTWAVAFDKEEKKDDRINETITKEHQLSMLWTLRLLI